MYLSSNNEAIKAVRYFCNIDGIPQGTFKFMYGRKTYKKATSFLEMGSWEVVENVGD